MSVLPLLPLNKPPALPTNSSSTITTAYTSPKLEEQAVKRRGEVSGDDEEEASDKSNQSFLQECENFISGLRVPSPHKKKAEEKRSDLIERATDDQMDDLLLQELEDYLNEEEMINRL